MGEGKNKIDMEKFIMGLLSKKSIDEEKQTYSELDKIKNELKLTKNLITPGLPFRIGTTQHAEGKMPYAILQVDNDYYTARLTENGEIFIKDFPKGSGEDFTGFSEDLAQAIDETYSIFAHMNEDEEAMNAAQSDFETDDYDHSDKDKENILNKVLGDLNILGKDYAKNKHDRKHGDGAINEWDEEETAQPVEKKIGIETSKIDRPTDAEGQPITTRARVEDLNTKAIGRVVRFGSDEKGVQTVHVDWTQNFGGPIPTTVTYPKSIVVRDEQRIVREEEIEEGLGHSHTMGRGENVKPANYPQTLKRVGMNESFDAAKILQEVNYSIPKGLQCFLVENSFNKTEEQINYSVRIPKQADETLKDIEKFIKEEAALSGKEYVNENIYTELEKATNKWIVKISI